MRLETLVDSTNLGRVICTDASPDGAGDSQKREAALQLCRCLIAWQNIEFHQTVRAGDVNLLG